MVLVLPKELSEEFEKLKILLLSRLHSFADFRALQVQQLKFVHPKQLTTKTTLILWSSITPINDLLACCSISFSVSAASL